MARYKDSLLGNGEAFAKGKQNVMVNVAKLEAGQNGRATQIDGYVSNANYVRRNIIAILVEAPRGFQDLPNSDKWVATLKSLVELHAQSIEGLQSTLTADFVESAVGGAGEFQEDISNVTRARSTPTFTWIEKYGKPINAFLTGWITNLLMDPVSKVPNVVTMNPNAPTDLLPDYTGATIMFIEPDPTHTRVVEAWLCTNMHPKTAGEVIGSRDLTAGGEVSSYAVEFTALTQHGVGVREFAQRYLDELNRSLVNPNLTPAFVQAIEADVKAAESGYSNQIDKMSSEAIDN